VPKLTKRFIEGIEPEEKERFFWDSEIEGFGLRVFPSGRKSYVVQYRNEVGRTRRLTLGPQGRLTPGEARKLARLRLASVAHGEDPSAERQSRRRSVSVAEFAERFMEQHASVKTKPSSQEAYRYWLERFILPALGTIPLNQVSREDVSQLHHRLRGHPTQANRVRALLHNMFNVAESWGLRPESSNPARRVPRFSEGKRERYLSEEEFARLGGVLDEAEREGRISPLAILAIRLLALTGARKGEVLGLKWREVDFQRRCLRLEDSKTGPKVIPLGSAALALLSRAPRVEGNPHVLAGKGPGEAYRGLQGPWETIRKRAGLADVRIHDLRHSYASVGVGAGMGLPIVGAILGHRLPSTTARYAHLSNDPLQRAAEQITTTIAEAMGGPRAAQDEASLVALDVYRRGSEELEQEGGEEGPEKSDPEI